MQKQPKQKQTETHMHKQIYHHIQTLIDGNEREKERELTWAGVAMSLGESNKSK